MPYTFYEGFGNAKVTNDLRARGYFVGSTAPTQVAAAIPYGANAVLSQSVAGSPNTAPGSSTNDPFCVQLSGRSMNDLWRSGGFILYWRAMSYLPGSTMRMPAWDGTQWILPTTNLVTGSFLGTSKTGADYVFNVAGGAQNQAGYNTLTGQSNVVYDSVSNQTIWADLNSTRTVVRYGNPTTGFAETQVFGGTLSVAGVYTNAGRTVVFGTDGSFPYMFYSDTGGAGPWTSVNVLGNAGMGDCVRHPTTPNSWVMPRVSGSGVNVSIDNLATAPFLSLPVTINSVAASPTAIVGVGNGSAFARCTAPDVSVVGNWTTGTLPVASQQALSIAYGNGKFVAMSNANFFVSTDDGLTWTTYTVASQFGAPNIASGIKQGRQTLSFQNGRFVLQSSNIETVIAESIDGQNWSLLWYGYNSSLAGTSAVNLASATGLFTSTVIGTPTAVDSATGFMLTGSATQTQTYSVGAGGVLQSGVSTTLAGVNAWHEFQMIFKPTATANQWTVRYAIDDALMPVTATTSTTAGAYPWFNLSRTGTFNVAGNLVFYEMTGAGDSTAQLGPDVRVYTDSPDTDDGVEWNPSNGALPNAKNIATGTVTGNTTFVSEAGTNKTDQYITTQNTPAMAKVLSMKHEAYFSRMLDNPAYVQIGSQYSGVPTDAPAIQAIAPVGSMNYVAQQLDVNPVTGTAWTPAQLNTTRFRVKRAPSTPVTTFLCHCDGTDGATTVATAINLGKGTNLSASGAIISTAQSVFGGSSIYIPAGGRWDFNAAFGAPALALGMYDFTIEFWLRTAATGFTTMISMDNVNGGNVTGGIHLTPGGLFAWNTASGGGWTLSATPSGTVNGNVWRHIAMCRQGQLIYLWVAGQPATNSPQLMATPISVNSATGASSGVFSLGATGAFDGYVDEIRISRGCRYTTAFTPPSAPFTS